MAPGVFYCPFLGSAHPMFDLGKSLLDWIEIRRVWRQEPQPCARIVDGRADGLGFVTAQIVHDHDVTWFEGRDKLLLDIGPEAGAVDGTVEDVRSGETVCAQGAEEGHGAPTAVGRKAAQPPALTPPSPERSHVGLDPSFVDEHQPVRIEAMLPAFPALPTPSDVSARLLAREHGFF